MRDSHRNLWKLALTTHSGICRREGLQWRNTHLNDVGDIWVAVDVGIPVGSGGFGAIRCGRNTSEFPRFEILDPQNVVLVAACVFADDKLTSCFLIEGIVSKSVSFTKIAYSVAVKLQAFVVVFVAVCVEVCVAVYLQQNVAKFVCVSCKFLFIYAITLHYVEVFVPAYHHTWLYSGIIATLSGEAMPSRSHLLSFASSGNKVALMAFPHNSEVIQATE